MHYVLANGQHRAATVVNAWPGNPDNRANLTVHLDQFNDVEAFQTSDGHTWYVAKQPLMPTGSACPKNGTLAVGSAKQDEEDKTPGTWHWPERE